jgi:hypothetical protein
MDNFFRIFPNPANEWVNFELDKEPLKNDLIIIYDMHGRALKVIVVDKKIIPISLQNYAAGIYILRYISDKTIQNSILTIR